MAQLKSYIRGLFWSEKDNIYTANLNNVDDTVIVHDLNDFIALARMIDQDSNGFKDAQILCDLGTLENFHLNSNMLKYNRITHKILTDDSNKDYIDTNMRYLVDIYEEEIEPTTEEAVVVGDEAVVTITPDNKGLIKVEFYSNDSDYNITVTLTKTDDSTESFIVPADVDNPFRYIIDNQEYSEMEIKWKYNETHSNTVTSYINSTD